MFKIYVPITKAKKKSSEPHMLEIEGIASSPAIDCHEERFTPEAIAKMVEQVNLGGIPIRIEHAELVFTDVGTWKTAEVDADNKMIVRGEIDTRLSLGSDIKVLLSKGMEIGLSVGGRVVDAVYEYASELKKNIRVYQEIILDEISIVKAPANYEDAWLAPLTKSVDWDSVEAGEFKHTTEAARLIAVHKGKKRVDPAAYSRMGWLEADLGVEVEPSTEKGSYSKKPKGKKGSSYKKWADEVLEQVYSAFQSEGFQKGDYEDESSAYVAKLSAEDLQVIVKLMKIMSEVTLPEDGDYPAKFDDDAWWSSLSDEHYIILWNREKVMPHHNTDFSVNEELVMYQLKQAIDYQGWWTPKDFNVIIDHLYRHLKGLSLVKSNSSSNPDTMTKKVKKTEEGAEETVETTEVEETEETASGSEETQTETEETSETTEETVEETTETEETSEVEETTEEVVEEEVGKSVAKTAGEPITKGEFQKLSKSVNDMAVLLKKATDGFKSEADDLRKAVEATEEVLAGIVPVFQKMAEVSAGRKSVAAYQAIEKSFENAQSTDATVLEKMAKAQEQGQSFREAYKTAKYGTEAEAQA